MHGLNAWMLRGLGDAERASALEALADTMRGHQTARGVEFASAMWLVSAVRP
jgi:hypothetical protein